MEMQVRGLKTGEAWPPLEDYTGKLDPSRLEPKLGESYRQQPAFVPILEDLNRRQYRNGLHKLDQLMEKGSNRLDAIRLKAEVFATLEYHAAAWEQYAQILKHFPGDSQALFQTAVLATILGEAEEAQSRKQELEEHHPSLAVLLNILLTFIGRNQSRTDFEEQIGQETPIDVLAVYGLGLGEAGDYPEQLVNRLKKTVLYAQRYPAADIIVSGGAVTTPFNEAVAMRKWLMEQGIPGGRIILEPLAKDTVGNSLGITSIVRGMHYQSCCVITSLTHLPRAWMSLVASFNREGLALPVYGAALEEPHSLSIPQSELRLSYHTTLRSAGLFTKNDFREWVK